MKLAEIKPLDTIDVEFVLEYLGYESMEALYEVGDRHIDFEYAGGAKPKKRFGPDNQELPPLEIGGAMPREGDIVHKMGKIYRIGNVGANDEVELLDFQTGKPASAIMLTSLQRQFDKKRSSDGKRFMWVPKQGGMFGKR